MVMPMSAKRCLFGSDHESTRTMLQEKKLEIYKDCMNKIKKWNFDFVNEAPLVGRYKWKRVIPASKQLKELPKSDCTHSDSEVEGSRSEPVTISDVRSPSSEKSPENVIVRPIPVKRKRDQSQQTTVNEYFPSKKAKTSKN